jgi:hypothetical protein
VNRFQLEVADLDRRRYRLVRALSFVGAAALAALALWSAGLSSPQWWADAERWWSGHEPAEHVAAGVPVAAPPKVTAPAVATDSKAVQGEGTDSSISAQPQPLYLVATAPGRNKNEGTARIGTSRDNPQTYVAGAILVNGARLTEIHADHVVLERGTKKASLFLASDRTAQPQGSLELAAVPAMPEKPATAELLGVDSLGAVIRSMAYYENDSLRGLQVFPGRQSGIFAQLGLKPADVIVSIDSVAVTDVPSSLEYLQTLTQGAAVSVRVRRDGAIHTLSLDGSLIEAANARTSALAQSAPPVLGRNSQ